MKYLSAVIFTLFIVFLFGNCSKSGKKRHLSIDVKSTGNKESNPVDSKGNVVSMTKINGVYEIPTEINGVSMFFIFDTGAGMISMSNTEARFLYKQGKLTNDDIIGNASFLNADGDTSTNVVVKLREVKIGNKILKDVEATIVPNLKAPLLFGQSALEKFGKVSIDYNKKQILFE